MGIGIGALGSIASPNVAAFVSNHVIYDMFIGTNGDDLSTHTPEIGDSWNQHAGNYEIQSRHGVLETKANPAGAWIDAGITDFVMEIGFANTANSDSNSFYGAIFRYVDSDNYWCWRTRPTGDAVDLYLVKAAGWNLHTSVAGCEGNTTGILTIHCFGDKIDIYWPNPNTLWDSTTWSDTVNEGTGYGLYSYDGDSDHVIWEWIKVKEVESTARAAI